MLFPFGQEQTKYNGNWQCFLLFVGLSDRQNGHGNSNVTSNIGGNPPGTATSYYQSMGIHHNQLLFQSINNHDVNGSRNGNVVKQQPQIEMQEQMV